jgi:hypothetical protein
LVSSPYDTPKESGELVTYEIPDPDKEEASEETIFYFRDFIRENAFQELERTLGKDSAGYKISTVIITMTNTGTPVEV